MTDDERKAIKSKFRNKRIYAVATNCIEVREFSNYARVWRDNLGFKRKQNILEESEKVFRLHFNEKIQAAPISEAVTIGIGPSVSTVLDHDLQGRFVIGCNSVAKSEALIAHCQLVVVCAGDVASHLAPAVMRLFFGVFCVHLLKTMKAYFLNDSIIRLLHNTMSLWIPDTPCTLLLIF